MPGDSTTTEAIDNTGVIAIAPTYPRITVDYYITRSVSVQPSGEEDPVKTKTYVNVIVTLTEVKIDDFSTVWDNLKSNITANTTAMTT